MFKITFEFEDRELKCMDYVNAALSEIPLSNLSIEDSVGYVVVDTVYDSENRAPEEINFVHGFDKITLVCEIQEKETQYNWQIDTRAYPEDEYANTRYINELWAEEYPDREVDEVIHNTYGIMDAFVVLHSKEEDDY